jgi:hypothetical protein
LKIISFVGFMNAGKTTAANVLVENGFIFLNFADSIKDCLSIIFGWRRDLLEGTTTESREFRETIDEWWAKKLNIENFTPRFAMQFFATNIMRKYFHNDIWVMHIENRLSKLSGHSIVFGDVRHPSEINLIKNLNGKIYRVKKDNDPVWFDTARLANQGNISAIAEMKKLGIHNSEWAWIGQTFDNEITNNTTIEKFKEKVKNLI